MLQAESHACYSLMLMDGEYIKCSLTTPTIILTKTIGLFVAT